MAAAGHNLEPTGVPCVLLMGRWVGLAVISGATALAALVSQSWPGFNSPGSEFYASLAPYGSVVADGAIEPSYIWTRHGYIAPLRPTEPLFVGPVNLTPVLSSGRLLQTRIEPERAATRR